MEAHQFFLVYHGKGYTKADTDAMHYDELLRHSEKLRKQLEAERDARKEMEAKIAAARRK